MEVGCLSAGLLYLHDMKFTHFECTCAHGHFSQPRRLDLNFMQLQVCSQAARLPFDSEHKVKCNERNFQAGGLHASNQPEESISDI